MAIYVRLPSGVLNTRGLSELVQPAIDYRTQYLACLIAEGFVRDEYNTISRPAEPSLAAWMCYFAACCGIAHQYPDACVLIFLIHVVSYVLLFSLYEKYQSSRMLAAAQDKIISSSGTRVGNYIVHFTRVRPDFLYCDNEREFCLWLIFVPCEYTSCSY